MQSLMIIGGYNCDMSSLYTDSKHSSTAAEARKLHPLHLYIYSLSGESSWM